MCPSYRLKFKKNQLLTLSICTWTLNKIFIEADKNVIKLIWAKFQKEPRGVSHRKKLFFKPSVPFSVIVFVLFFSSQEFDMWSLYKCGRYCRRQCYSKKLHKCVCLHNICTKLPNLPQLVINVNIALYLRSRNVKNPPRKCLLISYSLLFIFHFVSCVFNLFQTFFLCTLFSCAY